MLKRWMKGLFPKKKLTSDSLLAQCYPQHEHQLNPEQISPHALQTVKTLHQAGFLAYIVGGAVRDLLLGKTPKDFDIATNAHPEQVRRLFKRSRIIGRRFQIVHVIFGHETIEVTTFRGNPKKHHHQHKQNEHGQLLRDNVFGSLKDDAARRDFTMNALYYNPITNEVLDDFRGVEHIRLKTLQMIGDPEVRFREDPVRMLRALRFEAKLNFTLSPLIQEAIKIHHPLLHHIPSARLLDELIKTFHCGASYQSLVLLEHYQLLNIYLPQLHGHPELLAPDQFIHLALKETDQRILQGLPISVEFIFACLLWPLASAKLAEPHLGKMVPSDIYESLLSEHRGQLAIPARYISGIRELWMMQARFNQRSEARACRFIKQARFRAAFDLFAIRAKNQEVSSELLEWWSLFQQADPVEQKKMIPPPPSGSSTRRKKK
jgi:poly(A) polymerase